MFNNKIGEQNRLGHLLGDDQNDENLEAQQTHKDVKIRTIFEF